MRKTGDRPIACSNISSESSLDLSGKIVYTAALEDESQALFQYDFSTDTEYQITDGSIVVLNPVLSPQADWIAFNSGSGRDISIYLIRSDGTGLRELTTTIGLELFPSWSPDGEWIAYQYSTERGYTDIYVIHKDGGDPIQVTHSGGARPDWSPDGSRIAFNWRDEQDIYQIYTVNVDGSDLTQLTFDDLGVFSPTWSPDSTRIAFRGGDSQSYYISANGSGGAQQIPDLFDVGPLFWSYVSTIGYTKPGYESLLFISPDGTNKWEVETSFLWRTTLSSLSLDNLESSPAPNLSCNATISGSDVVALVNAITSANNAGTPQTICLETSTYTLTAVDHSADGPNGLLSISGDVTLIGHGAPSHEINHPSLPWWHRELVEGCCHIRMSCLSRRTKSGTLTSYGVGKFGLNAIQSVGEFKTELSIVYVRGTLVFLLYS